MAKTTSAPPAPSKPGGAPPSAKQQFAEVYTRESATTMRVLRALPDDKAGFTPPNEARSALQLAWSFAIENSLSVAALRGEWKLPPEFPPPPAKYADVVKAFEKGSAELLAALHAAPESKLAERVTFFTGPKQMGEVPIIELLWFMLLDSVHHRGQLSIYLRMAGCKVPSIYGPSRDEPWH